MYYKNVGKQKIIMLMCVHDVMMTNDADNRMQSYREKMN